MTSMPLAKNLKVCASIAVFPLATVACKGGAGKGASGKTDIVQGLPDDYTIIEYNGGKITAKDVSQAVNPEIKRFNEEAIEAYRKAAERILITKLVEAEAKKQGLGSPDALIQKVGESSEASDAQVAKFMKDNDLEKGFKDLRTGQRKKVSKDDVKRFLSEQGRQQKQQAFLQGLLASSGAKTVLEEPRTEVPTNNDAPFVGGKDAKVAVQIFSDFQCPYCEKAYPLVNQITQAYGDKVKVVFRQFPLPPHMHPEAKPAAIAAMCAHHQGKFWQMHDKLFQNQRELGADKYLAWGEEIGLDMKKYEPCVKNSETAKEVEAEQAAGEKAGVDSTPTFFVNGKKVKGAPQFEQFKNIIDGELARK